MISQIYVIIYGTDTIFPWWEAIYRDTSPGGRGGLPYETDGDARRLA